MKKAGKNTYIPSSAVTVGAWQAIVGQKEKEGPLGKYFDLYSNDEYFGQETYEKAEAQMQKEAMNRVFEKARSHAACAYRSDFFFVNKNTQRSARDICHIKLGF